jgi:2-phospho-L-lactate guanylyltransferase
MKALLIPVKDPANAKTRLGGVLSHEERRLLAWAMFEDVSRAVEGASGFDAAVLVSSYLPAIDHARRRGWQVLVEEVQQSESASVDWASRALETTGFDAVMRLPADLPLVQSEDIDYLFSLEVSSPGAIMVPSREGTGTNAIIRTPPTLFPSRFGPGSLELHKQEASRAGIVCRLIESPRIALDVDQPADLRLVMELAQGTATHRLMTSLGLPDRLDERRMRIEASPSRSV